ncbi:MAG: ATPase synthesis protein 25 mitochondrial [Geoglossum umbratile]|nr:MAG: ATPase synthesis protein 25 mitochondrial [Geoglossum umbratile]
MMPPIVIAGRCSSCRLAVLGLAVSTAGGPSHSGLPLALLCRDSRGGAQQQQRPFSKPRSVLSDYVPHKPAPEGGIAEGVQHVHEDWQSAAAGEDGNPDFASPLEALPWYLQVEIPQQVPQPVSDRQRIPDPPAASPSLLQPLMEHISVELGLDNLSIIDLRNLDPPPALGTNLIMILGTARSERHLHVSADRLCRWLRSNHKLTPFADGLLGRNELKLKLKRKARRSKLLGSVGALERDGADDGIRTGWVCVNIGRVGGENSDIGEAGGFVGFGSRSQGVRLVVQMLTEEKREELDLEGLWGGLMNRKARQDAKTEELAERATESHANETHVNTGIGDMPYAPPVQGTHFQSPSRAQTRSFHTSTRCAKEMPSLQAPAILGNDSLSAEGPNTSHVSGNPRDESMTRYLLSGVDEGKHCYAHRLLRKINPSILRESTQDSLRAHLNHFRRVPHKVALENLVVSPSSHMPSPFTFSFLQSLPLFPDLQHWQCQIELLCYGIEFGHRGWTKSDLMTLFQCMCMSTINIPATTFLTTLEGVLNKDGILGDGNHYGRKKWDSDIHMALHVLEEMSRRGHDILTEDVMVLLLERVNRLDSGRAGHQSATVAERCLNDIIYAYDIPFTKEGSLLRVLRLYARTNDWVNFWLFWKGIAMRALRRPEALYALMFRSIANTRNQAECMRALRVRIPDMESEEPPVQLVGEVALEAKRCLTVADPYVSADAKKAPLVDGEWTRLWRRCEHGLKQRARGNS